MMAIRQGGRRFELLAALGLALAAGCQSSNPAVQRSKQTADNLLDARQSLGASDQAVTDCQAALRTLGRSKGDLEPPFAAFVKQSDAVRRQADRQQNAADAVLARAAVYCAARQKDVSTIGSDALRHAAETRLAATQKQSQTIKGAYAKMNAAYATYVRQITDLQTYLANDLNYSALTPAQGPIADALAAGERLRAGIRDLAGQIELMSQTLSPVPLPTSAWPTTLRSATGPGES